MEFAGWQSMVQECEAILVRRTGTSSADWAQRLRDEGLSDQAHARDWLTGQGVGGRGQDAVIWAAFGLPEFFTATGDELLEAQYADRPELRPVADAVFAAVAGWPGLQLQARKTYIALRTPRRMFAQVVPATKSQVHLRLRLEVPASDRVEVLAPNRDQPLDRRIRLAAVEEVDTEVVHLLRQAFAASS
ncbi:DUF5655 domain-containing protein [Ruania zhangjianzhongii]|uniref:DUF5655 domain-containing protein n=1 Tax=Ruania zhangjianzhongii TaxID=2603206 RepID=UPI0011C9957A|nr:DUF5655 domain-containing protein [Ruania zhangjianzhongii]